MENFSLEELSASFRVLAKLNHPDVSKDKDAVKLMALINNGYEFLKDSLLSGKIKNFLETSRLIKKI